MPPENADTYTLDAAGQRTATHYPDNHIIREYYDSGDRLLQRQVRQRREEAEQIISTTDFRYDAEFHLISACTPDSRVEFEYDADGQVIAETLNGRRVAHRYDPLSGRPVAWQLDDVAVQFTHGVMGRMTHWQINDHLPLQFSHDALGRVIKPGCSTTMNTAACGR
ncbi:putative deoxyribonuclease RhsC [Salmonella enterica]|nr:putative deoxyribonuclease RhsC [Salmonella enterica]GAS77292.1 putative deoxyribonuclease RhsC [Salmonella enterica]